MNNQSVYVESSCSLAIIIGVGICSIVFNLIVSRFYSFEVPQLGTRIDWLSHEQTYATLHSLGLDFLTFDGSFFTLFMLYLTQLGNLVNLLNFNIGILHPEVLMSILDQLKFIISVHELVFDVLSSFVTMYENMDLDINYDPYTLEKDIRDTGNALYRLYRRIELELDYQNDDDLPVHWAENEHDII